jgi:ribose transport system permease protein
MTPAETKARPEDVGGSRTSALTERLSSILTSHALTVLLVAVVVFFTIDLPGTYLTSNNIPPTLATAAVSAILALAVLIPLVSANYDLSVGYVLGLSSIITIGLQAKSGIAWPLASLAGLGTGLAVGIVNGLLVRVAQINSFIATLGTGSVAYALGLWYTQGQSLVGVSAQGFTFLGGVRAEIPIPFVFALLLALVIWAVFEFAPAGRRLYVIGSSEQTAELLGIKVDRYVIASFALSGLLAGAAGVVLASQLLSAQSTTGPEYLLPAFAAVFLGSTAVRVGRVNVWGTIIAILLLTALITGLQQSGLDAWVQPFVYGLILLVAVGAAGYVQRAKARRVRTRDTDTQDRVRAVDDPPSNEGSDARFLLR